MRRHGGDVPDAGEHVHPEWASHFAVAQVAAASRPRMPKIRKYMSYFEEAWSLLKSTNSCLKVLMKLITDTWDISQLIY